jgi:hypothetical protein
MPDLVVCLVGCRQAGKTSAAMYCAGQALGSSFSIHKTTSDLLVANNLFENLVPVNRRTVTPQAFNATYPDCDIGIYAFADALKRFCIDVLGLSEAQCYGSNCDKNTVTQISWVEAKDLGADRNHEHESSDFMTARDVMEWFGTGVIRHLRPTAWLDATVSQIKQSKAHVAIITDCRFENELIAIKENFKNTLSIKLLRKADDGQQTPTDRSVATIPDSLIDHVVDNTNMIMSVKNRKIHRMIFKAWGKAIPW